jgi:hypothetical protein
VNLVITWSHNPYAKTPIPGKPSKSGLIGVWHKDNLYLRTSTIRNRDPHPTNIDSRTRSIRMTPRRQLFFDKSFFSFLENHGREIIAPTHTHTQSAANKKFYYFELSNLTCLVMPLFIVTPN